MADAQNLEDLKKVLYQSFNHIADKEKAYRNYDMDNYGRVSGKLAEMADKIANVEESITLINLMNKAAEAGREIEVDLDKRTIRSVAPSGGAKVNKIG